MRTNVHEPVAVLNASFEPLGIVPLHRALLFLIRERAVVIDAIPGRTVRSADNEFDYPRVIAFREMVRAPYSYRPMAWSRHGVLQRDDRECAYCGRRASTIDHVTPRAQGGENTWLNTISACPACNGKKGARTPEQADMPLRFQPREVTRRDTLTVGIGKLGADMKLIGLAA